MPKNQVTAQDVADAVGVSRATVSLVLRESPLVAEHTRTRVLAAIEELGYVYHRTAASLRSHRTNAIGLLVTDVSNPFFAELTVAVESELDGAGRVLLLGHSYESTRKQHRWLRVMTEYGVDGLLICPAEGTTPEVLQGLARAHIPHVLISRYIDNYQANFVAADNELGSRIATEHLVSHGCRRIAFVGGPEGSSARRDRKNGVVKALAEQGLELSESWSPPTITTPHAGYDATIRLMSSTIRPDGIVCYNDVIAIGAVKALQKVELRVGVDVRIIGFDDIREAANQQVSLTTISAPANVIGRKATLLLNQIIEREAAASTQIIIQPTLVKRASCGCDTD